MALWTDIVDPAWLTGYARESMANYEERKGTLARWLPNREVPSIDIKFVQGQTGLIDVADFRAYDAEVTIGKKPGGKRVTLELPALGRNFPVTEYEQLRGNGADPTDEEILETIKKTTDLAVRTVADAMERLRGTVLITGKATVDNGGFHIDDDFGRPAGHQLVASSLWTTQSVSRLAYLTTICDVYRDTTGEDPGSLVLSDRIFRAMAAGTEFQTQLLNGGARPATDSEVAGIISGAGLPPIYRYNRRVSVGGVSTKVLVDDTLLLLPEPVETDDWQGTDLGATFWGRTLTSTEASWDIAREDQPGIVTGVYREEKPPMLAEVIADAIGEPVLANADRSLAAKVL